MGWLLVGLVEGLSAVAGQQPADLALRRCDEQDCKGKDRQCEDQTEYRKQKKAGHSQKQPKRQYDKTERSTRKLFLNAI